MSEQPLAGTRVDESHPVPLGQVATKTYIAAKVWKVEVFHTFVVGGI